METENAVRVLMNYYRVGADGEAEQCEWSPTLIFDPAGSLKQEMVNGLFVSTVLRTFIQASAEQLPWETIVCRLANSTTLQEFIRDSETIYQHRSHTRAEALDCHEKAKLLVEFNQENQ